MCFSVFSTPIGSITAKGDVLSSAVDQRIVSSLADHSVSCPTLEATSAEDTTLLKSTSSPADQVVDLSGDSDDLQPKSSASAKKPLDRATAAQVTKALKKAGADVEAKDASLKSFPPHRLTDRKSVV